MAEYIEREAAIAFMNEVEPCICRNPDGAVFAATKDSDMLEFLRAIPAADVAPVRWIPVTERLPGREWVLCKCRAKIHEVLSLRDGYWYHDPQHQYMSGFVTHWMPLPEPPKAEEVE